MDEKSIDNSVNDSDNKRCAITDSVAGVLASANTVYCLAKSFQYLSEGQYIQGVGLGIFSFVGYRIAQESFTPTLQRAGKYIKSKI